jgi:hypothetical protein
MGQSESPGRNALILLDVSGDIGDKRRIPDLPPADRWSVVGLPSFTFLMMAL